MSYEAGLDAGRRRGWEDGYCLGRREALSRLLRPQPGPIREIKVMYVAQGSPGFHSIDLGIAEALRRSVRESLVLDGSEDIADAAARFRPDLVLVLNGLFSSPVELVDRIRAMGIRTAVWMADDPYFSAPLREVAGHYDYVFSNDTNGAAAHQASGHPAVRPLALAAGPELFRPLHVGLDRRWDVCFIGSAFPGRLAFFNRIADRLAGHRLFIAGGGWSEWAGYSRKRRQIRLEGVRPEEAVEIYNGSKIVLNLHRDSLAEPNNPQGIRAVTPNPRTFEICACGAFQLVDMRDELADYYVPGKEVAVYSSPEELADLIDYYLAHEEERRAIALNGLRRTLTDHTYDSRVRQLLAAIFG